MRLLIGKNLKLMNKYIGNLSRKSIFNIALIVLYILISFRLYFRLFSGIANFATTSVLYLGILLLIYLSYSLFQYSRKVLFVLCCFLFAQYSLEAGLRFILKSNISYAEEFGGCYYSATMTADDNVDMLLNEPGRSDAHTVEFSPFQERNPGDAEDIIRPYEIYNALGFRGWLPHKKDKIVIAFGDSFTESVCVELKNSYPVVLEKEIKKYDENLWVLNAGVSGNDPFYDWKMFHKIASRFDNIQSIIFLLNSSDINEVGQRGGHERFLENGRTKFKPGPFWEPLYAVSFVFRAVSYKFFDINYSLLTPKQEEKIHTEAIQAIRSLFEDDILPHCKKEGIPVYVVSHPIEWELQGGGASYFKMVAALNSIPNIHFVDIYDKIADAYDENPDIYYHSDGHFNETGYRIIANTVFDMMQDSVQQTLIDE